MILTVPSESFDPSKFHINGIHHMHHCPLPIAALAFDRARLLLGSSSRLKLRDFARRVPFVFDAGASCLDRSPRSLAMRRLL